MNPNPQSPDQKEQPDIRADGDPNRPGTFYGDDEKEKQGKDMPPEYQPGQYGSPQPGEEKKSPDKKQGM